MNTRYICSLFCLFFSFHLAAQDYTVQVAAFLEEVPSSYFTSKGVEGVYMQQDHNRIYRYFLGKYEKDLTLAEDELDIIVGSGFQNARVIDLNELRNCMVECGKNDGSVPSEYSGIETFNNRMFVRSIFFDFDKSYLRKKSKSELNNLHAMLEKYPTYRVRMQAHTDSRGSHDYNVALSKRRGNNAKRYLASKGIDASRIDVETFGEDKPVAVNEIKGKDSPQGRQFNRRVEFIVANESGEVIWDIIEQIVVPTKIQIQK